MALFEWRAPLFGIVVTAGAEQMRCAQASLMQAERAAEAREDAHGAPLTSFVLIEPREEVVHRAQREPLLRATAQYHLLVPFRIGVNRRQTGCQRLRRQLASHAARRHISRMGPLASEGDDNAQDLPNAAVHRAHAPGVGDSVVVELQLDFEVTFDTIQIHLDNLPSHSPILHPRRTVGRLAKITFSYCGSACGSFFGRSIWRNSGLLRGNFAPMHPTQE